MKKILCLLTLSLLLLAACAGGAESPAPTLQAEPAAAPEPVSTPEPVAAPEPRPAPEPAVEPEPQAAPETVVKPESQPAPEPANEPAASPEPGGEPSLDAALACAGQDISALYAAIGQPQDSFYEYSCSGPGDDGVLYYDGFLVFTYRENGVETVVDAEADE